MVLGLRISWLGEEDSNLRNMIQSHVAYRLADPPAQTSCIALLEPESIIPRVGMALNRRPRVTRVTPLPV